ncbi:MAG: NADH-quinone oxidoreductase subunit L [Kiritimatiellaeota bacterium]|nr:NADH-quinone oxidoreductase subunit L [Kiritimatiellota bacterium]
MFEALWLIPALPLTGFILLVAGQRWSRRAVAVIGAGSVGAAALVALGLAVRFLVAPPPGHAVSQVLWTWMNVAGLTPRISLYLDALSLTMTVVVTVVGFLIHLYSTACMAEQGEPPGEGYRRFFAYMNLFVASMLVLVLADNLLLLYLGWEGVGVCSYLLIGFWYQDPANGRAAMKAFIVTRVGDTALAVGLFLLFVHLGTLQIQEAMQRAAAQWTPGSTLAVAAAALLLGGAVGKSAQLPLQTWLPDAMAGPTPVSALIHAATMVTAGVYLVARTHVLFELAPAVQLLVAVLGAATLLFAGFSALTQWDLKRVLAYSTISQLGYMFLGLGVGAWSATMFHFVTHAVFKSLLFLAAGVVIARLHEEHNMFRMGGLRRKLPVVFWTFLAGACALTSLPPATAGFSKELILNAAWCSAGPGGPWLYGAGLAGVFLTALYTFRMVFLTFFGPPGDQTAKAFPAGSARRPLLEKAMALPLLVLAAGCLFGGLLEWPAALGGHPFFVKFMSSVFPGAAEECPLATERILSAAAVLATLLGALSAYVLFLRCPGFARALAATPAGAAVHRFWLSGWGFDGLYDRLFVRPLVWVARINQADFIDQMYQGLAQLNVGLHRLLSRTQNGRVRWYAAGLAVGAILLLMMAVFL